MKHSIVLFLMLTCATTFAQEITGTWNGVLEIQGTKLRLVFHINESDDGYTTTMDSPDQGAKDIATDKTEFNNNTLTITAAALGMKYSGVYSTENNTIEGTFEQGAFLLPLILSREVVKIEKVLRPQDPTSFNYHVEEIKFYNERDKIWLAGTLTTPKNKTAEKVVILISGSGPQNRDEEIAAFNHRPFLVLSDYLTRQGIAVLRYDDRGVAESEGDHSTATSLDFAYDALAAVNYIKNSNQLKNAKIGLAGHSEGGLIAPIVADMSKDVNFLVLLAAPGIPVPELMLLQSRRISVVQDVPKADIDANQKLLRKVYKYMQKNTKANTTDLTNGLIQILKKGFKKFPEATQKEIGDVQATAEKEAHSLTTPWFRYFINHDPARYISKIQIPVLALNGELDLQVTADENLAGIEKSLKKASNTKYRIIKFPKLNHLFQTAKTGAISEYKEIEETFNEPAMQEIAKWILKL